MVSAANHGIYTHTRSHSASGDFSLSFSFFSRPASGTHQITLLLLVSDAYDSLPMFKTTIQPIISHKKMTLCTWPLASRQKRERKKRNRLLLWVRKVQKLTSPHSFFIPLTAFSVLHLAPETKRQEVMNYNQWHTHCFHQCDWEPVSAAALRSEVTEFPVFNHNHRQRSCSHAAFLLIQDTNVRFSLVSRCC